MNLKSFAKSRVKSQKLVSSGSIHTQKGSGDPLGIGPELTKTKRKPMPVNTMSGN